MTDYIEQYQEDFGYEFYLWNDQSKKNYAEHQHIVDGWGSLMNPAWDHGLYFQAGQFYGLIAQIVIAYDDEPTE